jgi:hypothetical protein
MPLAPEPPVTRAYRFLVWVLNLLVPGAGLVLVGRVWRGVAVAAVWGTTAAFALLGLVWAGRIPGVLESSAIAFTVFWYGWGQVGLARRLRQIDRWAEAESRNARFRAALQAYVKGHADQAESLSKGLISEDPDDVEATLLLASIARRQKDLKRARRYFARARYLDDEGRWDFEIERELAALASPPADRRSNPTAG